MSAKNISSEKMSFNTGGSYAGYAAKKTPKAVIIHNTDDGPAAPKKGGTYKPTKNNKFYKG